MTTRQATLATAHQILDRLEAMWRDRLDRFGDVLADPPKGDMT